MHNDRNALLIANWKMNMLWEEGEAFVSGLRLLLPDYFNSAGAALIAPALELAICPATPYISQLSQLTESSAIFIGAQDASAHEAGAHTGQVSAQMLADTGCDFCIVGHSEQRALPGTDALQLSGKLERLLSVEVIPVLCVGEALPVREGGGHAAFVLNQLDELHGAMHLDGPDDLVIAYEPVWAIGTGRNAEPPQAQEMAAAIRGWLGERFGDAGRRASILYGGSVTAQNAGGFFDCPDIDGALVGGASLRYDSFAAIAQAALARLI